MKKLFVLILCLTLLACTNSGSDDDSSGGENPINAGSFTTDCGVVSNGRIELPIDSENGVLGSARIISANQVAFITEKGTTLVKLQGINDLNPTLNASAVSFLNNLARGEVIFFAADGDCTTVVTGGGVARVGQIFTTSGLSFSEELIQEGLATINQSDACGGNLIGSCYEALLESSAPTETISNFLWKPVSERDGNLAVLLNPGNATVVVNGVTLTDTGGSNGRGTTARANRSGGSFGSNITVQVFDELGRALVFPNGNRSYIIVNGSSRVEF